MRLHGWCQTCHRFRLVTVRVYVPRQTPVGTCAECEEKEAARRRRRSG